MHCRLLFNIVFSLVCKGSLHTETYTVYATIYKTANAKRYNANEAYCKACTGYDAAFEWRHRGVVPVYVHSLYDEQVVVERNNGVYESNEHQHLEPRTKGTHKYKELAEKTCKGRYSRKREERKCG